jgi:hypothetical protein
MTIAISLVAWFFFWWFIDTLRPQIQFWVYTTFSALCAICFGAEILGAFSLGEKIKYLHAGVLFFGFLWFAFWANVYRNKYKPTMLAKKLNEKE